MNLGKDMTLDEALTLVLIGIEEGCRKSGQDISVSIDELADMLDSDMGGLARAMEIFGEQMGHNIEQPTKKKAKKKEDKK